MARVTVEDCLSKETNRFSLVLLAAQRAKQLLSGAGSTIGDTDNKSIVTALREIAAGKVRFMNEEDLRIKTEKEEAQRAAMAKQAASEAKSEAEQANGSLTVNGNGSSVSTPEPDA